MIVLKEFEFDAAHYLPSYNGKCEHLHGHTYKLVVKVDGRPDMEGMVLDFSLLKKIVQTSAENIAIWVWDQLAKPLYAENRRLYEVEVWETRTSGCIYRGEFYEGELC